MAQTGKSLPAMQETQFWPLGSEDPLEKEIATHSSILAETIRGVTGSDWVRMHAVQRLGPGFGRWTNRSYSTGCGSALGPLQLLPICWTTVFSLPHTRDCSKPQRCWREQTRYHLCSLSWTLNRGKKASDKKPNSYMILCQGMTGVLKKTKIGHGDWDDKSEGKGSSLRAEARGGPREGRVSAQTSTSTIQMGTTGAIQMGARGQPVPP